jgi:uncharacterized protein YndB with AHSA1/START domain
MPLQFEVSTTLPTTPQLIYAAWLNSAGHSAMTGAAATASDRVEGAFTAWDGYISGRNVQLEPGKRIVQAWRTVEFSDADPDSLVEILLAPHPEGTQITVRHSQLPPHGAQYEQGWIDNYFEPMRRYFAA